MKFAVQLYSLRGHIKDGADLLHILEEVKKLGFEGVEFAGFFGLDAPTLKAKLDELGFYQDCLDKLGGVTFSQENVKPGYIVRMKRWGNVTVVGTGPKNFTHKTANSPIVLTDSYAEIVAVVKAVEAVPEQHPYKVGDTFTCHRWNRMIPPHGDTEKVTYTIIRATEKSVTLKTGDEKPIVRKPIKRDWRDDWQVSVTDWTDGTWYKAAAETK